MMKKSILILVLAIFIGGCSESSTDDVKISTDESGNTVYNAKVESGKSLGIVPAGDQVNAVTEVDSLGEFKVGQIWTYHSRPEEADSRVTIVRLEKSPKVGGIVHVSLSGLKIENPSAPGGFTSEASHLPFSEKAMKESVLKLESQTETIPDYLEGYEIWALAFKQGKAGIFTTSLIDGVDFLDETFKKANSQQVEEGQ